ncbi:translation initiation factor Sui1 [Paludibacterium purpuratum]|uniref:Translation initiation factor 1 (eIF-1/SUI1) n=1 Tax=Paludibacterium purpuratum TaxID=1144873 RepID=A0A4R7AYT9_9NEIS|nr:translation initiation factor Sui1 [Paludibacterium purpuratum]TDR73250.1 translation initiation factor 1 (eIF-1/SUI1) [Paludibacterium purpuratum]
MKSGKGGGLVYSTEHGRMCPQCRQPIDACTCARQSATPTGDGTVRIRCETKGRQGKGVTVIRGVPLVADELARFAKSLRQRCGSGGTVKDGVIEIQGDHVVLLIPLLQQQGWVVKRNGG